VAELELPDISDEQREHNGEPLLLLFRTQQVDSLINILYGLIDCFQGLSFD